MNHDKNEASVCWFSSKEIKSLLKISDCDLMHFRTEGKLQSKKIGNAYFYVLPNTYPLLSHPLGLQLKNWYKDRHPTDIKNEPQSPMTIKSLEMLVAEILLPIERKFGVVHITYGFTSAALSRYIVKNSPSGIAPKLDQHASCEVNNIKNEICDRRGSACDLIIEDIKMSDVVRYITKELNYDRIYFFGDKRPLHVSVNESANQHLQIMGESKLGRRYPGKKAFGNDAILLAESL